jgi:GR25 family glycosyltransferase involved in LPS biosynthesis
MNTFGYFLIHGLNKKRRIFMNAQFRYAKINDQNITWINHPNSDEVLPDNICINPNLTLGQIAITYKHSIALSLFLESRYDFGVILEDNIEFLSTPLENRLNQYISQLPSNWDCVFDSDFFNLRFIEKATHPTRLVYQKSNETTDQCHGSSKGAHFYLVNKRSAKLLVDSFIPFSNVSDHHLNHLFKKLNMNIFWAEPPNIHKISRPSTWL